MRQKSILLVEDESSIAIALEKKLTTINGVYLDIVRTGDEAAKVLRKFNYDIILMDLLLPGKTGFELLAQLGNQQNTIPVIIVSNLSKGDFIDQVQFPFVKEYLVKSDSTLGTIYDTVLHYIS